MTTDDQITQACHQDCANIARGKFAESFRKSDTLDPEIVTIALRRAWELGFGRGAAEERANRSESDAFGICLALSDYSHRHYDELDEDLEEIVQRARNLKV